MRQTAPLLTLLLLSVLCLAALAGAQDPAAEELTVKALEAKRKALKEETGLDEALRTKLLAECDRALQFLKQAEVDNKRATQYETARKGAPDRLAAAKAELARKVEVDLPAPEAGTALPELEARLQEATQAAKDAASRLKELGKEGGQRAARLPLIPKELSAAKARLPKIDEELVKPAAEGEPERLTATAKTGLKAERAAVEAAIAALENESAWYSAGQELLTVDRDLAARSAAAAERIRKAWQDVVQQRRKKRAQEAEKEARKSRAEVAHEELKSLADENAELAQRLPTLAAALEKAAAASEEADRRLKRLEQRHQDVKSIIEDVGLTDAVGAILRERKAWLNDERRDLRLFMSDRRNELAELQVRKFELEQQRVGLMDLDVAAQRFAARRLKDVPAARRQAVATGAQELLQQRRGYIDEILTQTDKYLQLLREIKSTETKLAEQADAFDAFIKERILWIRSALPVWDSRGFPSTTRVADWVCSAEHWAQTGATLLGDARRHWASFLVAILLVGGLLLLRGRLIAAIERAGAAAADSSCVSFRPTVSSIFLTVLVAVPVPLIMLFLSWRLYAATRHDFTHALAFGLESTGWLLLGLALCSNLCRPRGLAEAHFDLVPAALGTVRRNLFRVTCFLLPLHFLSQLFEQAIDLTAMDSMGRGSFMLQSILFGAFMGSVFGPRAGILAHKLRSHHALRRGAFALAVGVPLALAVLAAFGYYLTALELSGRIPPTLAIILGWLVFYWLARRFLRVSRRGILLREEGTTEPAALEDEDKRGRFEQAEVQSRQLLLSLVTVCIAVGAWRIWADVLPAVGYWRELELWDTSATVDGQVVPVPVTLVDLIMAVVYAVVTIFAARSIPGMLRITVFQRLPEGDRLAFAKVAQYLILFVGVIVVLSTIRLQWSHMQWAVAGLSVGLGFGLQEIFANFMSGLIILFERPIRVGDLVTVGGTQGKVSEVRVRSTTIMDFDMRELIVPNKDFITKEIVNWTLSSPVTRVVVPVSVSVAADPARVREILMTLAADNPRVLDDPAPWAILGSFGNSALEFRLNVYIATRGDWFAVTNGMHEDIVRAFRQADIEFALRRSEIRLRRVDETDALEHAMRHHDDPGGSTSV